MRFRQYLIKIKLPFCHISTVLSNNPAVHMLTPFLKEMARQNHSEEDD
jgi:Na+/H+ antiporter NhaD/arsenite permease-like protein